MGNNDVDGGTEQGWDGVTPNGKLKTSNTESEDIVVGPSALFELVASASTPSVVSCIVKNKANLPKSESIQIDALPCAKPRTFPDLDPIETGFPSFLDQT